MVELHHVMIIAPIIIFILGIFIVTKILDKKRKEALASVAASMGLMYSEEGPEGFLKKLQIDFKFFRKGISCKLYSVIEGRQRGIKWQIFEFRYKTASGKNSSIHRQTMALATIEKDLPKITIQPRWFFHAAAKFFGGKEVEFEEGLFSKIYIVYGDNPEKIKKTVSTEFRHQLANEEKKYSVEILKGKILIYRQNFRIKPEKFTGYYQMLNRLVSQLNS